VSPDNSVLGARFWRNRYRAAHRLREQLEDQNRRLEVELKRNAELRRRVASLELENAELRRQLEERP
jgi:cell division protein FtsB